MKKKDHVREYATAAFQFYAKKGRPDFRTLKAQYMAEALDSYQRQHEKGSGIGKPTEEAVIYAEKQMDKKTAELLDILAVEKVFNILNRDERKAVEIVYFTVHDRYFKKGEISDLVCNASLDIPASINTVYRYLRKARMLFAEERGLRI